MNENYRSLDKLSFGIGYLQTAIARISGLLLMVGLIVAMANLLTEDAVFSAHPWTQQWWAWSQAIAVDSGLALVFVRLVIAAVDRTWIRVVAYAVVGIMLLFVAASITAIESVRQAFNISLTAAADQVHISLLLLAVVRSIVSVLLVAVSGLDFVVESRMKNDHLDQKEQVDQVKQSDQETPVIEVHVSERTPQSVVGTIPVEKEPRRSRSNGHGNRVQEYLAINPEAKTKDVALALSVSEPTVRRERRKMNANAIEPLTEGVLA